MPTDANDGANAFIRRFVTVEFLGVLVVVGISWGSLASDVSTHNAQHAAEVHELKQEQKALAHNVHEVDRKLGVIETNQDHFKEQLKQQREKQEETLRILRSQYPQ